ncbi:MAG: bifunctional demethylmenaquinone methyltransferase/2-methoxy-6-polyprenyl-1,4-benzoquinol methylase UbiE [Ignavibacterium sp.]|nr:MAG: bifunctional demethylmenaquinone methyltransferase/2-methoxy-6-polyprenyl-1,4-benzoquinol methylase UbiE [Ignavibacterium sp.]
MIEKKTAVKRIFDSIAFRYDLLNHLLSFGMDFYWRKKALKLTTINDNSKLLDIACGTGDFAIAARKIGVNNIFGADLSKNMLELFYKKASWVSGRTLQMVAEKIPLKDGSVTNITVAFGVRNFYNIEEGFKSFYRIIAPEGEVTILEFRMPENRIFKSVYRFYFKKVIPFLGGMISGDKEAYEYLPSSVEEFDEKIDLTEMLKTAGFKNVISTPLNFGIVQVIISTK